MSRLPLTMRRADLEHITVRKRIGGKFREVGWVDREPCYSGAGLMWVALKLNHEGRRRKHTVAHISGDSCWYQPASTGSRERWFKLRGAALEWCAS